MTSAGTGAGHIASIRRAGKRDHLPAPVEGISAKVPIERAMP